MNEFQKHFPQIQFLKNRKQVYLDSAATTLKPNCIIDVIKQFYKEQTANVHRGAHFLSDDLTLQYENVRTKIQKWIEADHTEEIIFTKSTTEGINFLSCSLENLFQPGDLILLTEMEHHSNLLPWQLLAQKKGLKLDFLSVNEQGELNEEEWNKKINEKVKLFAFTYYSNAVGTRNPVEKLCKKAKEQGVLTVVDSAQAMTVEPVNVKKIDCDFLLFSSHKMFSAGGLGVLYAKKQHFSKMKPYQLGGGMVADVNFTNYSTAPPPKGFEAGTPPIEAVLSLGAVLNFLEEQNYFKLIQQPPYSSLLNTLEEQLKTIPGLKIIGSSPTKKNISSFVVKNIHCNDLGQLISKAGTAVRAGHHCCLPLMKKWNLLSGTVRASFSLYNDAQDAALLLEAVKKAVKILT